MAGADAHGCQHQQQHQQLQSGVLPHAHAVRCPVLCASVFNRDYKAQLRGRWSVLQEQYSWWGRTEVGDRRSTLNAVLARKYDQGEQSASCKHAPGVAMVAAVFVTDWHTWQWTATLHCASHGTCVT